uniref:Uncharacterized protein n=1 Tax=Arundo donax TaxID=35708 RepID=A0A0A9HMR3_ARUDO
MSHATDVHPIRAFFSSNTQESCVSLYYRGKREYLNPYKQQSPSLTVKVLGDCYSSYGLITDYITEHDPTWDTHPSPYPTKNMRFCNLSTCIVHKKLVIQPLIFMDIIQITK